MGNKNIYIANFADGYPCLRFALLVILLIAIFASHASATTRTWDNGDGDNDWDSDANWNANGNAPGERANDDSDDIAVFQNAGHTEVDVRKNGDDSYDFYLRELRFQSTQDWYLDHHHNSTRLRFDINNNSTTDLTVEDTSGSGGSHTIEARIWIEDELEISQNSSGTFKIIGNVDGAEGFIKSGTGTLEFSGNSDLTFNDADANEDIFLQGGITDVKSSYEWHTQSRIYVGRDEGDAVFNVDGSGTTIELTGTAGSRADLRVGSDNGATGTMNISNDAYVHVASRVNIGGHDADNQYGNGVINVSSGADLNAASELRLGNDAGGSTGVLTVDGSGSTVTVGTETFIGRHGTGSITVQNDADFTANGDVYVGEGQDANGDGSLVVTGSGSTFTTTGGSDDLFVGHDQGEGRVVASNTAAITVTGLFSVGDDTSNAKGFVTIESGASLDLATTSYIGRFGTGQVVVTGSNSTMSIASNQLSVGRDGSGEGYLEIAAGAKLTATAASTTTYVARGGNSNGSMVITGSGSTALLNELLIADEAGSLGHVTIAAGADIDVSGTTTIADAGTGTLTVTGANSKIKSTTILVGNAAGSVGTLTIASSGVVEATTVTVAQTGSTITADNITVGSGSDKITTLNINSGGTVSTTGKITIDSGGTLNLNRDEGIVSGSAMELAGGTFNTNGNQQDTVSMGDLTLTANSIIDMGASDSIINWAAIDENTWTGTLLIHNWTGTKATAGGTDQLIFSDITDFGKNAQVWFYSGSGTGLIAQAGYFKDIGGGKWELVPAPEPSTWLGISMLLAFAVWRERKRFPKS